MTLLQKIKQDQLQARKDRDQIKASILTTLIGEAAMVGKNDGNRESTDDEVQRVVKKFLVNIKETWKVIEGRESADHLDQLVREEEILESYLPKQLSEEDLRKVVTGLIAETQATSLKDMGKHMKLLKERYAGTYDGALANSLIKQALGA